MCSSGATHDCQKRSGAVRVAFSGGRCCPPFAGHTLLLSLLPEFVGSLVISLPEENIHANETGHLPLFIWNQKNGTAERPKERQPCRCHREPVLPVFGPRNRYLLIYHGGLCGTGPSFPDCPDPCSAVQLDLMTVHRNPRSGFENMKGVSTPIDENYYHYIGLVCISGVVVPDLTDVRCALGAYRGTLLTAGGRILDNVNHAHEKLPQNFRRWRQCQANRDFRNTESISSLTQ